MYHITAPITAPPPPKYSQLRSMLSILKDNNVTVHVILHCETLLTNNNADLFPIPGYSFVHMSRTKLSRGGVAMYILNKYNYTQRLDLYISVAIAHLGLYTSDIGWGQWVNIVHETVCRLVRGWLGCLVRCHE